MAFADFLNRFLGDPNERELKRLWPLVHRVREVQASSAIRTLTLADIPKRTEELRQKVQTGVPLDDLLPDAFALVNHTCILIQGKCVRIGQQEFTWDMVPFDVQVLGGIVLHRGCIAEMKTGEGKTLVCTMPVYLNSLAGKGVHVVTVNDYLARRDALWMGMLYEALGLSVGTIVHDLGTEERKAAYACDVAYGTNNEFGFDYLRDNMAPSLEHQVQRGLAYGIIDEVDSILIDEARTPLIISQPAEESTAKYMQYALLVRQLQEHVHYERDEKQRTATLTEEGIKGMEQLLGVENIYTERGFEEVHHIEQALRAHAIYQRDVDYVIKDGEVIIVDEFTGRLMPGRRYGHGLHQAIEAKEGVEVQRESRTLATITFQNYFRLYEKLAGMTGTAKTEEEEFESIYHLRVVVVPTNRPCIRRDKQDAVYRTTETKFNAVARIVQEKYEKGQPVLVGTTSIEKSEALSAILQGRGVPHQVLNAKHHEEEADIVARAGQKSAVTIATNMAGRGTDIKLGLGVTELGGLCVLGTERHEARRIDNQLRGRCGRQGDLGESLCFVSMEDELMRLFGGDRLRGMMERLKVPDDVPLENTMVSHSIESAQKRVEGRNFDIRRHVLQYDDVMNKHREIIYRRRKRLLEHHAHSESGSSAQGESESHPLHEEVLHTMRRVVGCIVRTHVRDLPVSQWNTDALHEGFSTLHPLLGQRMQREVLQGMCEQAELIEHLSRVLLKFYSEKCRTYDAITILQVERLMLLRAIDVHWMSHIDDLAHLREQVAFAGYAQRDPLVEYQDQAFHRFEQLLVAIDDTATRALLQVDLEQFVSHVLSQEESREVDTNEKVIEATLTETGVRGHGPTMGKIRGGTKVGRNDPCPCGSGHKYKKCHGQNR